MIEKQTKNYTLFDGMCWPTPNAATSELEWKLRYSTVTREEQLIIASVIQSYKALVFSTQKKRNYVCSVLKEAARQEASND